MSSGGDNLIPFNKKNYLQEEVVYTKQQAIREFDELKNVALNCFDKNGNPNISAALRAIENKAKIAGLYLQTKNESAIVLNMNDITIDGKQLKLDIGEDYLK